ncbi:MAG: class I SAM-dependent methyltransferase [Candidatus Aenigmatarchaeota archaeon]
MMDASTYEKITGTKVRYDILYKYESVSDMVRKYGKGDIDLLDVGCAFGIFSFFADKGWKIHGIDRNPERIAKAKRSTLGNATFNVGDAETFETGKKFDVVIALDIIEHLVHPDACLKRISDSLKREGLLVVSNPNYFSAWNVLNFFFRLEDHRHWWNPSEFVRMAEKHGFTLLEMKPRPMLSEAIGWAIRDYRPFYGLDKKLGSLFPRFSTGWFLVFRKAAN